MIGHGITINTRHVNGSKLHLNKKGTRILFNNFKEAISKKPYYSDSFYYIVFLTGIIARVIMILIIIVPMMYKALRIFVHGI